MYLSNYVVYFSDVVHTWALLIIASFNSTNQNETNLTQAVVTPGNSRHG